MQKILAADIGGTNSRFAIFSSKNSNPEYQIKFPTAAYINFNELLLDFKSKQNKFSFAEIQSAVFAIAAPIVDPKNINPPNISWNIDVSEIKNILGITKAKLINDFQAQALSVLSASKEQFTEIAKGVVNDYYPQAVIGAGTGFGKSLLVKVNDHSFISIASEGGHVDFPAIGSKEVEFRKFAINKFNLNNLDWDDVLSGRGLEAIHEFLSGEKIKASEISEKYLNQNSETLEMFSRFYGRAARNYVLETLALGGLYIVGGVAAKNPLLIKSESFRESFLSSVYSDILAKLPIFLIESDDSGLKGAAYEAFRFI